MKTCSRCRQKIRPTEDQSKKCCLNCRTQRLRKKNNPEPALDFEITVDEPVSPSDRIAELIAAARHPDATIESVCDALDCSPASLRLLINEAHNLGYAVELDGTQIGIRPTASSDTPELVAPLVGVKVLIGAISDLHFGSKYCCRAELKDFVKYAYDRGVREILIPGDMLDGCYKHGRWELSHHGMEEQTQDALETLPVKDGLHYRFITGNHDQTFVDTCGVSVGRYLVHYFEKNGRHDLHWYGDAGAYLKVYGALVHLQHPRGGVPYAMSYRLQKQVEAYAPGLKPDILLMGHLHKYAQICSRGVHAFLVPCFQHGGSAFSNSLVGGPALGGLILSWGTTEHGTLRSFTSELVSYYHDERVRDVAVDTVEP